jgi:hypothetical protein
MSSEFQSEDLKEKDNSGNLEIDKKIILKLISEKWDVRLRTQLFWLRILHSSNLL